MPNDADTLATFEVPALVHRCSCGVGHTLADWSALPLVGYSPDYAGGWLCLRNCECGSTRSVECATAPAEYGPAPDLTHKDTMPAPPPDFAATLAGFAMMTQWEGCQS